MSYVTLLVSSCALCGALFLGAVSDGWAVEVEFVKPSRAGLKSSIKSIGRGIQQGNLASLLETSQLRRELLIIKQEFVSRFSRKPVSLKCRYAPAPVKQQRLELKHAVEVRLDVPLNVQLRNASVSVAVDRGANTAESASVIFSFSF